MISFHRFLHKRCWFFPWRNTGFGNLFILSGMPRGLPLAWNSRESSGILQNWQFYIWGRRQGRPLQGTWLISLLWPKRNWPCCSVRCRRPPEWGARGGIAHGCGLTFKHPPFSAPSLSGLSDTLTHWAFCLQINFLNLNTEYMGKRHTF